MRYKAIFFFLLFCSHLGVMEAQTTTKPKVLILTTGGTIASKTDAPIIQGNELIEAVPELTYYADIEVEEFSRIGSSRMTPANWLQLVQRINTLLKEKPYLTCIIITHGTDTMEETAFFLNLTHRWETPVVLVGSMRSSNEVSADGPANLIGAVRAGIAAEAIGKGVMVVLNDNISAGRDLLKMNNRRVDAFPATEQGYLGFIDPEKVTFFRTPYKPHTTGSDFNIYDLDSLPQVDIVQDYAGIDPAILTYFLNRPNQGLVVSSFAGGRMSNGFQGLSDLSATDKPVVIASSIKGSRIMGSNPPGSSIIIANDFPANKARILLMLALTRTQDVREIQGYFDKY